jgi:hypothetical protein
MEMKRLMMVATITLLATRAFAATRTWTGEISDSMCGKSHKAMRAQYGGKLNDAECTEACVRAGGKYVFVYGSRVYTIANQDERDLALHAGKTVRLTGDRQGTTIIVSNIATTRKREPATH